MKRNIKMRNIIGILALTMVTSAYADDHHTGYADYKETGYFCSQLSRCRTGDIMVFEMTQYEVAARCNQNSAITRKGDVVVCQYRGVIRNRR